MGNYKKPIFICVFVFMTFFWLLSGPVLVSSPEFHVAVYDDSGKPVDNAVVVVAWQSKGWHSHDGIVALNEGLTLKSGKFIVDSWFQLKPPWRFNIEVDTPIIAVFKPGLIMTNTATTTVTNEPHLVWQNLSYSKDILTIALSDPESFDRPFPRFRDTLRNALYPIRDCWRDIIPLTLNYLESNTSELTQDQLKILTNKNC